MSDLHPDLDYAETLEDLAVHSHDPVTASSYRRLKVSYLAAHNNILQQMSVYVGVAILYFFNKFDEKFGGDGADDKDELRAGALRNIEALTGVIEGLKVAMQQVARIGKLTGWLRAAIFGIVALLILGILETGLLAFILYFIIRLWTAR